MYRQGTHRTVSPAETLARVRPFLDAMGITRVANVTGLDRIGIPVVTVVRPNSRSVAVSQGKGATLDAAKASGVMEAIEGFHAERIEKPLRLGSRNELAASLDLADLDGLARLHGSRVDGDLPLLWIEGFDWIAKRSVWLPYEVVHSNYTLPSVARSGCFVESTNGLASGNHMLEAVAHGIAEVVERDATTLWNRLPDATRRKTRLDLDSVDDLTCSSLIGQLRNAGMSVGVWNITSDVGVPSFFCLIVDDRLKLGHSGAGAGCHPAREIALLRALTEAVQVRTNYITGARDDLRRDEYEASGLAAKLAWARRLMDGQTSVDFRQIASTDFVSLGEDIDWMLERLQGVGIGQVISVDLTRPEFGVPVARVVIPGLEGPDDHDHYSPGLRALALGGRRP
ncbi:YcaO-like family protein [Aminobacter sp. AP02]|uniref:YcaO-like family protein n=1 Tax=Aminobacter sp. AP02 TaxID=2135737 RepID=UPI0018EEC416|nr:YcaO-like family protein [Aminobacter sp. AP02]